MTAIGSSTASSAAAPCHARAGDASAGLRQQHAVLLILGERLQGIEPRTDRRGAVEEALHSRADGVDPGDAAQHVADLVLHVDGERDRWLTGGGYRRSACAAGSGGSTRGLQALDLLLDGEKLHADLRERRRDRHAVGRLVTADLPHRPRDKAAAVVELLQAGVEEGERLVDLLNLRVDAGVDEGLARVDRGRGVDLLPQLLPALRDEGPHLEVQVRVIIASTLGLRPLEVEMRAQHGEGGSDVAKVAVVATLLGLERREAGFHRCVLWNEDGMIIQPGPRWTRRWRS